VRELKKANEALQRRVEEESTSKQALQQALQAMPPPAEPLPPDELAELMREKLMTLHERNACLVLEATSARHDAEIASLAADLLSERLIATAKRSRSPLAAIHPVGGDREVML